MVIDEERAQAGLVGKLVGRYKIVSELARDNRRTLYEAEHVEHHERVVFAVVRAVGAATERLRKAEQLRSLRQPVLVRVLDVGKVDNADLFIATERAIGAPLRTLIAAKPIDQRRALTIIRDVLEGLAAAHAVGAIHADITPESILVAMEGQLERVKLTGVGLGTLTGATKGGDPRYSAPEFALGAVDARADLYSVGAVLFELLTGHPPFVANDVSALRRLHAYAPMQTLKQRAPDLSFVRALEEVVAMALAKKPAARLQSATDMIALVDNALHSIEEVTPVPQEASGVRRRKANDSLLLLAKDLMPSSQPSAELAIVPVNVGRKVPELPASTRVGLWLRKTPERLRAFGGWLVTSLRAANTKLGISARLRGLVRKR